MMIEKNAIVCTDTNELLARNPPPGSPPKKAAFSITRYQDITFSVRQPTLDERAGGSPEILFRVALEIPDWEQMRQNQDTFFAVSFTLDDGDGHTLLPVQEPDLGLPQDPDSRDLLGNSDALRFQQATDLRAGAPRPVTLHIRVICEVGPDRTEEEETLDFTLGAGR